MSDSTPYDAKVIAAWFVQHANELKKPVSNLKLQKLLYFAQGYSLVLNHQPLFLQPLEAWEHGPVVPDVYHQYKASGSGAIRPTTWSASDCVPLRDQDLTLLQEVWAEYGSCDAIQLRNLTHAEAPWAQAYDGSRRHSQIDMDLMRETFSRRCIAGEPLVVSKKTFHLILKSADANEASPKLARALARYA